MDFVVAIADFFTGLISALRVVSLGLSPLVLFWEFIPGCSEIIAMTSGSFFEFLFRLLAHLFCNLAIMVSGERVCRAGFLFKNTI